MKNILNIILLIIVSVYSYSCNNSIMKNQDIGESCTYDTECLVGLSCINDRCEKLLECNNDNDCHGNIRCLENACKCEIGICEVYHPCDNNPCNEENKTVCSEISSENFYICSCSENFILKNENCVYDCSDREFTHTNDNNTGCDCNEGYEDINGMCKFKCLYKFTHTNDNNTGCVCDEGYILLDGACKFDCSDDEFSHTNDNNTGCDCNDDYLLIDGICKFDCSSDINSQPNEINNDCICKEGYTLKGGICTFICDNNSFVNNDNNGCNCKNGFFKNLENNCVTPCSENPCMSAETCTPITYEQFSCSCNCQNNGLCTTNGCNCDNTGYEGDLCNIDIDECTISTDNCGEIRDCINTEGSYTCVDRVLFYDDFTNSDMNINWNLWGSPLPHQNINDEYENGKGVSTGGDANWHSGFYSKNFLLDMNSSFSITARIKENASGSKPWDVIQFGIGNRSSGYSDREASDYVYVSLRCEIPSGQYVAYDRKLKYGVSGYDSNLTIDLGNDMNWHIHKIEYRKTVDSINIKIYQDDILKFEASGIDIPPEENLPISIHGRDTYHGNFIDWVKVETLR